MSQHSTEYLYGIKPAELENKLYFEALQYKKEEGRKLYLKLYDNKDRVWEEDVQFHYVNKAQVHTQSLLDERG
jgi:hypothetical protein